MASLRERLTTKWVEIGVLVGLTGLGLLVIYDAMRLGPGFTERGPQPGFFPFSLTILMLIGIGVTLLTLRKQKDAPPFFEVDQEIVDLLKVGIPMAIAILLVPWLGLYVTAGLYLAFFMAWYGRFPWYWAVFGGIVLPIVLWVVLRIGFTLPMPMSMWYGRGLPF